MGLRQTVRAGPGHRPGRYVALQHALSLDALSALPLLDQAKLALTLAVLSAAYLLGGTSGDYPGRAMIIELLAVALLALTLITWKGRRPSWGAILGIVVILGLPLLQLLPLPALLWQIMPGRDVARDIAAFIDPGMSRPITLDSEATMKSWLSLFVPVSLFLAVLQSATTQRLLLCIALIAIALVSFVLGLMQVSTGIAALYPFEFSHDALPIGLFTNRNHQATLFYAAAAMAMIVIKQAPAGASLQRMVGIGLIVAFAAGILATQSRAGLALFVLVLLLSIPLFIRDRINWWIVMVGAVSLAGLAFLLAQSGVVNDAIGRYARVASDGRYDMWADAWVAAQAYYPFGAGMGTFVKAYQGMEPLSVVGGHYVNHAHNDYIELVLEFGALAYAGLALFFIWYAIRAYRVILREAYGSANLIARVALIVILVLLLHSIVDYPIRTFAHLGLFGLLCGLLYRPVEDMPSQPAEAGTPERAAAVVVAFDTRQGKEASVA